MSFTEFPWLTGVLILLVGVVGWVVAASVLAARRSKTWRETVHQLARNHPRSGTPDGLSNLLYAFVAIADSYLDADPDLKDRVRLNVSTENRLMVVFDRTPDRRIRFQFRRLMGRAARQFAEELAADESGP